MNPHVTTKFAFVALTMALGAVGCNSNETEPEDKYGSVQVEEQYDREMQGLISESGGADLSANAEAFAMDLFKLTANGDDGGKNFMLSPLSISLALSMTMNGAGTTTLEAMLSGLGFDDVPLKDVNTYYAQVVKSLEANNKLTLEIADSIWVRDDYQPLKRSFYEMVTEYYDAEIFPLAGVDTINEWVAESTHNKIQSILDQLEDNTALVLVNAIYFNGEWQEAFEKDDTNRQDFQTEQGTIQVDMMHKSSDEFSYKRGLGYEAITLPYKDDRTSLIVFIPSSDSSLQEFYDNVLYKGTSNGQYQYSWQDDDWQWIEDPNETVFSGFAGGKITLSLPRFSFEYGKSLKDDLEALGMDEIFGLSADFSNFANNRSPYISEVKHKTFIDVNEKGTEAAAVTAVVATDSADGGPYINLEVNRPFFFCIKDNQTKAILFTGQVTDPSK